MSVNFVSPQQGYVLGTDGELWITEDAGETWKLTLLFVEELYQTHLFVIEQITDTSLVVSERGGIFYSKDKFSNW